MTTAVALKINGKVWVATDSRVTGGDLIIPSKFNKIIEHPKYVLACSGNVRELEVLRLLIGIDKNKNYFPDNREEFSYDLFVLLKQHGLGEADGNSMPMCGVSMIAATADRIFVTCGLIGGFAEIDNFIAIGSGSEIALGAIGATYQPEMLEEDISNYIADIFEVVYKFDVGSGGDVEIRSIEKKKAKKKTTKKKKPIKKKVMKKTPKKK